MWVGVDMIFKVDVKFFYGFFIFVLCYCIYEVNICNLDLGVCVGVFGEV